MMTNNVGNLPQMISSFIKLGTGNQKQLLNFLIQQNPQLKELNSLMNNINPEKAKNKIQEMANSGLFTKEQLENFSNIAKNMGVKQEDLDKINSSINFKTVKKNRW